MKKNLKISKYDDYKLIIKFKNFQNEYITTFNTDDLLINNIVEILDGKYIVPFKYFDILRSTNTTSQFFIGFKLVKNNLVLRYLNNLTVFKKNGNNITIIEKEGIKLLKIYKQ